MIKQKHFIDVDQLSLKQIEQIFSKADKYLKKPLNSSLKGKRLINLFFENSTRTRSSFEIAAKNSGAEVVNIDVSTSALKKGESEKDTILTLNAMEPDFITIRHSFGGIVKKLAEYSDRAVVVNSGDGAHAHPTQALLDAFTIYKAYKFKKITEFKKLTVAICGDVLNSRVARSNIRLLTMLGAKIHLIGPPTLLPKNMDSANLKIFYDLKEGVKGVNVIMALRIQKERMMSCFIPSISDYFKVYGITRDVLDLAKSNCILLHPGPMNRNVEIESSLAEDPKVSQVLKQVRHGVAIRQAVLELLA